LTYEEVKVVAPDFWLREAEYAAVEIKNSHPAVVSIQKK